MARYSLFMLKVPLNTNQQPTNHCRWICIICVCGRKEREADFANVSAHAKSSQHSSVT